MSAYTYYTCLSLFNNPFSGFFPDKIVTLPVCICLLLRRQWSFSNSFVLVAANIYHIWYYGMKIYFSLGDWCACNRTICRFVTCAGLNKGRAVLILSLPSIIWVRESSIAGQCVVVIL